MTGHLGRSLSLMRKLTEADILLAQPNYVGDAIDRKGPFHRRLISELTAVADELADALRIKP